MIKAVLDTNIIISALFWKGLPCEIVKSGIGGEFQMITSEEILMEIKGKLESKFNAPQDKINELIKIILVNSFVVIPTCEIKAVKIDPNDDKIIECAIAGEAHFIVSGDKHLLDLKQYKYIKIANSQEFLEDIARGNKYYVKRTINF